MKIDRKEDEMVVQNARSRSLTICYLLPSFEGGYDED